MNIDFSVLEKKEAIALQLRSLYLKKGYSNYRLNKFEEYDLYAENKDFLVSDNVITFTDTDGKLLALKPDVTLSVIKNSLDEPNVTKKLCYNENVYRVSKGANNFKEIMQSGVECFGNVDDECVYEVVSLALDSLKTLSDGYVLALSDLDIMQSVISRVSSSPKTSKEVYKAVGEKNFDLLKTLTESEVLIKLLSLSGTLKEMIASLDEMIEPLNISEYAVFRKVLVRLSESEYADHVTVDLSILGDLNYYNGLVFKGYLKNVPLEVLSGGKYDNLLKKMRRRSKAIGFAVYTDLLEFDFSNTDDGYLNVALPKGRLGDKVYALFAELGYECPSILEPNRKLVFENEEKKIRYFMVKPSDIAIYVERGAADIGVAGKDIIDEYLPDVYELADLGLGKCRMAVAAPKTFADDESKPLRVATKFSRIARNHYQSKGRDIDVIHLNGSIEIAPILGLSDVIVDIVETGRTLEENDLAVVEEVEKISARLIANKSAFKFKSGAINEIINRLNKKKAL